MSFSLKELSCIASLSGRFCSKLRQDHFNTAKTISQEPQQPEEHHPEVALDGCHAIKEYCLFLKHYAGSDAKYSHTSEAAKEQQAHTDHWQPHRAMNTAGQAQQIYRPVTSIPFTSETHNGSISSSTCSPHQWLYGEANKPLNTIQQTCTFLS